MIRFSHLPQFCTLTPSGIFGASEIKGARLILVVCEQIGQVWIILENFLICLVHVNGS